MIKKFNSIYHNGRFKDSEPPADFDYSIRITDIKFDTETKVLTFNTASDRSDIIHQNWTFNNTIVIETIDDKRLYTFDTNQSHSLKISLDKIKLGIRFYSVYRTQVLDLTEPNTNTLPSVSDSDRNLGDKNTGFLISYQVSDKENDPIVVIEKLNGTVLRTLNNAPKGQDLAINISKDQLYALPLNVENKISIEVNDGKGGISYRNYTFRRTNTAPVINGTDRDLGVIAAIGEKYTVNDMEGNAVNVVEKLNNTILRTFAAGLGKEYTTTIDKDTWIKLKNGQHTYSIEATDSNNSKTTRVFSFTKRENKIDFTLVKPFTTDIKASKILVTPSWELNGATAKVEVCNNAFDVNPTWEDITKQVLINRHYNFTNTTKTADKWGVNIRIYIEKDQSYSAEVSIKGFGGAFE